MKICFWGDIASALIGKTEGGGELQLALLAKTLAKAGHEVVVIDYATEKDFITVDGIKIVKIKNWNRGLRMIRTFTHRLPSLFLALKEQKADVYYCRIRDFRHIFAYWAARKVKGKFILALASDLDALNFTMRLKHQYLVSYVGLWSYFNGILIEFVYPFLLRKADLVLVQHEGQEKILRSKGIKSQIFTNLIESTKIPVLSSYSEKKDFVYVGWLSKRKGFPEFYNLITKCPLHSFKIIGPPSDKAGYLYYKKLQSFQNVTLLGKLNHSEVLNNIKNSKALISTSQMEGFPNIFIEAWACGIPVLSLYVDPGNIIEKEDLGIAAHGDSNILLKAILNIKNNDEFAGRARSYVERTHILNDQRLEEANRLLEDLFNNI